MSTTLESIRKPTQAERKRGADVVFERSGGHVILACVCYESWEQWGAPTDVLSDNCPAVDAWRALGEQACARGDLGGLFEEVTQ